MDDANPHPRISADPKIMVDKPCIRGTRIPVYVILEYMPDGASFRHLQDAFPAICDDDIRAAIEYAADAVRMPPVAAE
ncbi:MAG: DUF433 domain-containing protein [Pseudomonadota bacterium]